MGEGQGEGEIFLLFTRTFDFWFLTFNLLYCHHPDAECHEQDSQADGELEQALLHAAPRPVDAIRLSEDASQPAAAHLQGNYQNQSGSYDTLGN
jgi:hypothetical protein